MSSLHQALEARIAEKTLELPLLPEVANQVIQLTQNPDATASQLAQLIQSDQALASHVMRIANSAAYSPNAQLVSLQQAITRLGMNMIAEISLAATLNEKMFNAPGFEKHVSNIWKFSLATALWAKEIARVTRRNVDATFLCGLLHAIGRPVALQAALEIAQEQGITLTAEDVSEIEKLYQKQIGLIVCKEWDMPLLVQETIEYLETYDDAPNAREQAAMVNGASCFSTLTLNNSELNEEQLRELPIIEDLNLYQDEVDELLEKLDTLKATVEAIGS